MKLKMVYPVNVSEVPDHIIEEVNALSSKMADALKPIIDFKNPNLTLSAFNFLHAGLIRMLISETKEDLQNAANHCASSLIKNVDVLIQVMESKYDH